MAIRHGFFPWPNISLVILRVATLAPLHSTFMDLITSEYIKSCSWQICLTPCSEWCGNSTFQASYAATEALYSAYNIPAYFSEFGCPTDPVTDWSEVGALLSSDMSPVWSGGVAFSYFPSTSAQGDYGIVSISAGGSTVTVNQNYDNLKTQYTQASPPNSPSESAAGSTSYPACPQQNSTMLASSILPPTPDLAACTCLENNLNCQFTPTTSNYSAIVGSLLDYGCSQLGQLGASCNPISADGATGVYGAVSACDPSTCHFFPCVMS